MIYGLELDDRETFEISDWTGQKTRTFTESSYLQYLFDEGRSSVRDVQPKGCKEAFLALGRRSGKSHLESLLVAYEAYRQLMRICPQDFYGFHRSACLQVTWVVPNQDFVRYAIRELEGVALRSDLFQPYLDSVSNSLVKLDAPLYKLVKDYEQFRPYWKNLMDTVGFPPPPQWLEDEVTRGLSRSQMRIWVKSCRTRSLQGSASTAVFLSEMAHYPDDVDQDVYNSLTPSLWGLPKEPGKLISISSPSLTRGRFYQLYQMGMTPGVATQNMLSMRIPTWEMNPTIPASELQKYKDQDEKHFRCEVGAEFMTPEEVSDGRC
jgi:hypothetical protein